MSHSRKTVHRLNFRLLGLVLGSVAAVAVLGAVLLSVQRASSQRGLLIQARQLHKKGEDGLADTYLSAYIAQNPRNIEVLALEGEILGAPNRTPDDWQRAVWMYEQILRVSPDSKSETSQKARRELIRLHLSLGPMVPRMLKRYQTARVLADHLLANGATDVESLQLAASIKLRMADLGDRSGLDEAMKLLEQVHAKQPKDVPSTLALATLYRDQFEDVDRATRLMDQLLAENRSPATYLARSRFLRELSRIYANQGRIAQSRKLVSQARDEIKNAVEMAPKSYVVCISAAESALQEGDYAQARKHLLRLDEKERETNKVRMMLGLCELQGEEADQAVETWRRGLLMSEGNDVDLTWWLSYIEFQRDHLAEGRQLADQYRRLVGGEETPPGYQFLMAVEALTRKRPFAAIDLLRKAAASASSDMGGQIYLTLAKCYDQVRNERSAREAYEEAIRLDPRLVEARLGLAKSARALDPAEAQHELKLAVQTIGDDPGLLAELGRLLIAGQLKLNPVQRSWTEIENLVKRAVEAAPESPQTIVFQAEVLALKGQTEESLKLLKGAIDKDPAQADFWEAYAQTLVENGQIDEAVSALQEATSRQPTADRVKLRIMDARLLDALGRTDEANAVLTQGLERLPVGDRAMLWLALGDLYLIRDNLEDARKAFQQGAQLLPDDPMPLLHLLDMSLNKKSGSQAERDKAVREALSGLERISGDNGPYYWLGRSLVLIENAGRQTGSDRDEKLEEARGLIERARTMIPNERYPHILDGRLKTLLGKPQEAVVAYERAMNCEGGEIVEPQLRALYQELGRQDDLTRLRRARSHQPPSLDRFAAESYIRQGEDEKAREQAETIVKRDPNNLELRVWQARLLKTTGKADKAEATLKDLVQRQPEQIGPRVALLYFLVGMEKHEEARELIESIGREIPKLSRPEFMMAQCWTIAGETQQASSAFETSLKRWPDDPQILVDAAKFFVSEGRSDRAESLVRAYLAKHRDQKWVKRSLALLLSGHQGDREAWNEAWSLCKPDSKEADEPDDLFTRAVVLSRAPGEDRAAEAVTLLEKLLPVLPTDLPSASQARRLLIALHLQLDRPALAAKVASVEAAQESTPETIRLYVETLIASGSLGEADRHLSHLEKIEEGVPANSLLRARLLGAQKLPRKAAQLLEPQARLWIESEDASEKTRAAAREAVGLLLSMNQNDAAERIARKLADRFPKDQSLVGVVLARQDRLDEAIQILVDSVPTADPGMVREIAHNLGFAAHKRPDDLESIDRAIEGVRATIDRSPSDPELRLRLAALYHLKKDYAREADLYQEALKLNPVNRGFLNNLAWVLSEELNRPKDALPFVAQAIEESNRPRPDILDTRGVIYTRMNRTKEAIEDLERAAEALPNPSILAHLARAYHQAGQMDKYRVTRDRALRAGLKPEMLQPSELQELGPLFFDSHDTT